MKIVVFTGAGVSRESGLRTFRDSGDGLWEGYDVMQVASIRGWWQDPATVLSFYDMRRREVLAAEPNPAHYAIASLEDRHEVTVITQNVDDLHERAGSTHVIHLHGEVLKVHPTDDVTATRPWTGDLQLGDTDERGIQLRPFVVWFGEGLPELPRALDIALSSDVDVLIVSGTSLNVYPAAQIATETRARRVFVVDPNPPDLDLPNVEWIIAEAGIGLPKLVESL